MNITEIRICQNHEYYMFARVMYMEICACTCFWCVKYPMLSTDAGFLQRLPEWLTQQRWADIQTDWKKEKVQRKTTQSAPYTQQRSSRIVVTCPTRITCLCYAKLRGEAAKLSKCINIRIHETERERKRSRGKERGSVCVVNLVCG